MRILIVGCGYVGAEFIRQCQVKLASPEVFCLTRTPERAEQLRLLGAEPLVGNWCDARSLPDLTNFQAVLFAVPHRPVDPFDESTHAVGIRNVLDKLAQPPQRVLYLSTTGVFAGEAGEVVDDNTPAKPTRTASKIAVAGEAAVLLRAVDGNTTVLRLAGIYGPGRLPLVEKVRQQEPLTVPPDAHVNLIHVEDIGRLLVQLLAKRLPETTYVFSDGSPVLRREFYHEIARKLDVAPPQFEVASDGSSGRRSTDKRIDPQRLMEHAGFQCKYPSYREGLAACGW